MTISRMRRHAPIWPTDPNFCLWGVVMDLINYANFFENRFRGSGAGRPWKMAFLIESVHRPYNSAALPRRLIISFPVSQSFRSTVLTRKSFAEFSPRLHITDWTVVRALGYWSIAWLSDFSTTAIEARPSTDFHAKVFKRRGFTQGCAFYSKNRYLSLATSLLANRYLSLWSPGPLKGQKKFGT